MHPGGALFVFLPVERIGYAYSMDEGFLFGEFDIGLLLSDVDIPVVAILEAIEEIEAAEFGQTPTDTCLGADLADILAAVLLLVLGRVERVLQFHPKVGFDGTESVRISHSARSRR